MKNLIIALAAFAVAGFMTACTKEETKANNTNNNTNPYTIPSNLKKVGETWVGGAKAKAEIYAEQDLFVGYNKIYVALSDSLNGERLIDGHFEIEPEMDMGTMVHASPFEHQDTTLADNGLFKGAVVFTMAGNWKLHIHFHNHKNGLEGEGEATLVVTLPSITLIKSFKDTDSATVYVTLASPTFSPKVGINNFEVLLHKKQTMMSFPALTDLTVEIDPTMPSMGHGSPNNVNPVHTEKGHYLGKANFTMTGLWRVALTVKRGGTVLNNTLYFDITL